MIGYLMAYLQYISTRPLLIAATIVVVIGLIAYGRLTARKRA